MAISLFVLQQLPDLLCNGAVGGVDTGLKTAIYLGEIAVFCNHCHHAALINGAAVAAEKAFLFHFYSSVMQKPPGAKEF